MFSGFVLLVMDCVDDLSSTITTTVPIDWRAEVGLAIWGCTSTRGRRGTGSISSLQTVHVCTEAVVPTSSLIV